MRVLGTPSAHAHRVLQHLQIGTSSIWQAIVSTENLEIPQHVEKHLTGSRTNSFFQDELQFHGVRWLDGYSYHPDKF
jgi:hypothetical protein